MYYNLNIVFSADDFSGQYMRSLALVNHTGRVFWPPPTKFRSTCPVDVAFFPFDDQTCILKLGSWLHDGYSVRLCFTKVHAEIIIFIFNIHSVSNHVQEKNYIKRYFRRKRREGSRNEELENNLCNIRQQWS